MRQNVQDAIRQRVSGLLETRPDLSYKEFGEAIGRGYAWVYAFVNGTRHANDVRLVAKIARYFGVTVGYLVGEADRQLDPGAVTLLATWQALNDEDRRLLLDVVATFRRRTSGSGDGGTGDDGNPGSSRTRPIGAKPPRRKR